MRRAEWQRRIHEESRQESIAKGKGTEGSRVVGQLCKPRHVGYNFGSKVTASAKPFLRWSEGEQRKSNEIGFIFKDMTQKLHVSNAQIPSIQAWAHGCIYMQESLRKIVRHWASMRPGKTWKKREMDSKGHN